MMTKSVGIKFCHYSKALELKFTDSIWDKKRMKLKWVADHEWEACADIYLHLHPLFLNYWHLTLALSTIKMVWNITGIWVKNVNC